MAGGTVQPAGELARLSELARGRGAAIHMDGARLLNACAATGQGVDEVTRFVDTVSINLNKGLSAPAGALLCGPRRTLDAARVHLKRLGGWSALGKAGPVAAAGLVALETMTPQLADDNARARRLAGLLAALPNLEVDLDRVQTNIVMVGIAPSVMDAGTFVRRLEVAGVRAYPYTRDSVRFVTHRHIGDAEVDMVAGAVRGVMGPAS